ncbi:MAG: hypothetical protein NVSMB52_01940 [Chloroflexota bacterium]
MSLLWILIWFLYRGLEGVTPELRLINFWLLTLIVAAIIDATHYRRYATRGRKRR